MPDPVLCPTTARADSLRPGCYRLILEPDLQPDEYRWGLAGTLRLEAADGGWFFSGDLYLVLQPRTEELGWRRGWEPPPDPGIGPGSTIPVHPRENHAYHLAGTGIAPAGEDLDLVFDLMRLEEDEAYFLGEESLGPCSVHLQRQGTGETASFVGSARRPDGTALGALHLDWVSPFFRRARIEVQSTPACLPLESPGAAVGAPKDLEEVFAAAGWAVEVDAEEIDLPYPEERAWSRADLHRVMLGWRVGGDLDHQWTYHLLMVPRIDAAARGLMYDISSFDSNLVPREGAALAQHDFFDEEAPLLTGAAEELRRACLFRTAVHELGHVMGLDHNSLDAGYMCTTDEILPGAPTLEAISWAFHPNDLRRLRHWPDPMVRPGGLPFAFSEWQNQQQGIQDTADWARLSATPTRESFPLGAPVRLDLRCVVQQEVLLGSLDEGPLRGEVIGPDGARRRFRSLNRCTEGALGLRRAGEELEAGLTLTRSRDGALFPTAGRHRVEILVPLRSGERRGLLDARCEVLIEEVDAPAARAVLRERDLHPAEVVDSGLAPGATRILRRGLEVPELRPHLAFREAFRLARRGRRHRSRIEELLKDAVRTRSEERQRKGWGKHWAQEEESEG